MHILRTKDYSRKKLKWVFAAFPCPEVLLAYQNTEDLILQYSISNPGDLLRKMTMQEGLKLKAPDALYDHVFSTTEVNTIEKVGVIFDLLKVGINETEVVNSMISYMYRYLYESTFQAFVNRGLELKRELTLWWPIERIEKEIDLLVEKESVKYIDIIKMPKHCSIIDNNIDLIKESQKLDHCAHEHWGEVKDRKSFFISMKFPEETTFEISRDLYMNDFRIVEAVGYGNCEPTDEAIDIIACWLKLDWVQDFFEINYTEH